MRREKAFLSVVDHKGEDKAAYPVNFFIIALGAAVVIHLFFLENFLLILPVKNFSAKKGFAFLGSILDSSQMEKRPILGRTTESEQVVFSHYVPPRSEQEYFESLKEVVKPRVDIVRSKKEVKSTFSAVYERSLGKSEAQWQAQKAVGYQSLRLPDAP